MDLSPRPERDHRLRQCPSRALGLGHHLSPFEDRCLRCRQTKSQLQDEYQALFDHWEFEQRMIEAINYKNERNVHLNSIEPGFEPEPYIHPWWSTPCPVRGEGKSHLGAGDLDWCLACNGTPTHIARDRVPPRAEWTHLMGTPEPVIADPMLGMTHEEFYRRWPHLDPNEQAARRLKNVIEDGVVFWYRPCPENPGGTHDPVGDVDDGPCAHCGEESYIGLERDTGITIGRIERQMLNTARQQLHDILEPYVLPIEAAPSMAMCDAAGVHLGSAAHQPYECPTFQSEKKILIGSAEHGTRLYDSCIHCGIDVVWHQGNGGQWLGAHPPDDCRYCYCSAAPDAQKHEVAPPQPVKFDPDARLTFKVERSKIPNPSEETSMASHKPEEIIQEWITQMGRLGANLVTDLKDAMLLADAEGNSPPEPATKPLTFKSALDFGNYNLDDIETFVIHRLAQGPASLVDIIMAKQEEFTRPTNNGEVHATINALIADDMVTMRLEEIEPMAEYGHVFRLTDKGRAYVMYTAEPEEVVTGPHDIAEEILTVDPTDFEANEVDHVKEGILTHLSKGQMRPSELLGKMAMDFPGGQGFGDFMTGLKEAGLVEYIPAATGAYGHWRLAQTAPVPSQGIHSNDYPYSDKAKEKAQESRQAMWERDPVAYAMENRFVQDVTNPQVFETEEKTALGSLAIAPDEPSEGDIEEVDRNARAYGFEIGKGHPLTHMILSTSPDNPFMQPGWREMIGVPIQHVSQPADLNHQARINGPYIEVIDDQGRWQRVVAVQTAIEAAHDCVDLSRRLGECYAVMDALAKVDIASYYRREVNRFIQRLRDASTLGSLSDSAYIEMLEDIRAHEPKAVVTEAHINAKVESMLSLPDFDTWVKERGITPETHDLGEEFAKYLGEMGGSDEPVAFRRVADALSEEDPCDPASTAPSDPPTSASSDADPVL